MKGDCTAVCARCVMDASATGIVFDQDGICSYCAELLARATGTLFEDASERRRRLNALLSQVRREGRRKRYDCVVGVSGGVDSSWALVKAVELGLRPLAVHMDNGWNSELAQNNIANLLRGLGVDLYTHVIDWEEYRGLMQAFFDADVIDVELLYDNAMLAVNYQQAARFGVKSILAGTNTSSEGMRMPAEWAWLKYDARNIRAIAKRFGGVRMLSFPSIGTIGRIWHEIGQRRKWVNFLDYFEYRKSEAMGRLVEEFMFKPYPYKHYESVFTRFYQGYILPVKFGVDKRRLHFSSLIIAGQMDRKSALDDLNSPAYGSAHDLAEDRSYFLKKMRWCDEDLERYLNRPAVRHGVYDSERPLYQWLSSLDRRRRESSPGGT